MNKKIIALLMTICMMITAFAGCGSKATNAANDNKDNGEITVTDMLGREVTIKRTPQRIIAFRGALRFYCYISSTDKIVGMEDVDKRSVKGKPYMIANQELTKLPSIGSSKSINYEKVLQLKPDVIFFASGADKITVDKLQQKLGIPVVAVSYGIESIFDQEVYDSLKIMGKVMREEKRSNEVVEYMENCKKDLNDRTKDIPDDKKPTAYAGAVACCGSHGIESTLEKNPLFKVLNVKNVADNTGKKSYSRGSATMIDKEKLIEWDPDKIFIDLSGIQLVKEDYKKNSNYYKTLSAFKNGEVYTQLPHKYYRSNIDTAMVDAYYIGKSLYPEQFKDINPEKKADEIYKFLLGKEVYSDMAKDYFGGFQKVTFD